MTDRNERKLQSLMTINHLVPVGKINSSLSQSNKNSRYGVQASKQAILPIQDFNYGSKMKAQYLELYGCRVVLTVTVVIIITAHW
jgi:hypothetical protein